MDFLQQCDLTYICLLYILASLLWPLLCSCRVDFDAAPFSSCLVIPSRIVSQSIPQILRDRKGDICNSLIVKRSEECCLTARSFQTTLRAGTGRFLFYLSFRMQRDWIYRYRGPANTYPGG
ncbi:hypothetical protein MPTK1_2g08560 [Marchantia polymorpha subsp. ruderalis]|uniref:Uncharacterized protein n=1 Tax=Marchantia polymorpha TaxID=3197 RepID=A0A2R6XGW0_MARPO|nr:hypothetical protein MARPO_0015s0141 [Marchantia polymorpha]BBN01579.1 hypothetical protein Mp_2g08560 [Marchantia polymorpha subsp. ruderalis]|eukprot:PTQ45346.1 hypothetical protein MARPO_0015s0141 [Marchantia polymorpha]